MGICNGIVLSASRHILLLAAATAVGGVAGVATADGGGGPSPGAGIKCPESSPCGAIICGGTTGCWCDSSQAGNEVCLQN